MFAHWRCMWVVSFVCASDVSTVDALIIGYTKKHNPNRLRMTRDYFAYLFDFNYRPASQTHAARTLGVSVSVMPRSELWSTAATTAAIIPNRHSILKVFAPKDGILTKIECPQWLPDHLINNVSSIAFDWTEIVHLHLSRSSSATILSHKPVAHAHSRTCSPWDGSVQYIYLL